MSETSKCNRCGTTLPPDAPEGLCPRCLIAANLATQTDVTGESGPAKLPPLPVSDVSKLFPQLEILECLGRGGMGAVYKARQPRLDRLVALKILSPEKQGNQKFAERFEREARALAKLHHPNIVTVYDFGEVQGNFYLLMEFVDGLTLRQLLQSGRLSPPEALAIVPMICEALQYAHGQGIVHRDIKPENILMDKEGHVKIADFGIAKILGDGTRGNLTEAQAIGTPHYMSPEQIEKPQTVDHRADIYSLGVVFYEMLTGELPLGRFQPPSKKVHVDVRLDEIVLRALEKEPERRYQQAGEIKTHVETVAATAGAGRGGEAQTGKLETQRVERSKTKSGLIRIVEVFFDITFKSRLAIILLNLSALGFLGCLGFLGYLPGMRFCFGFFGFTGFFGLIGVAFLVEFFSSPRPSNISKSLLPLVAIAVLAGLTVLAIYLHRHSKNSAEGADEILAKQPPVVVETFPVSGAQDVEPGETKIRVRFSKDMMDNSWSWSSAWENSTPDSTSAPQYDTAHRTCSLKVKLEPGRTYAFWLNSGNFHNFQDSDGHPAVPYLLIFHTKAPNPPLALTNTNHPYVLSVWPPDGATNVETRQEMRIRFSHGMNPNGLEMMWISGGFLSCGQPRYNFEQNEFQVPVELLAGVTNTLHIGWAAQGFHDTNGNPADEFIWNFTTKPFTPGSGAIKPNIVQIIPSTAQTLSVLTLFQLTFDQPMTLDFGNPYLKGDVFDLPTLVSDFTYDPASHRVTVPVILPPDNETKLTLHGFYSADGVAADPVVIRCNIGTNNYSDDQRAQISEAAGDPRLKQLLTSMKAARAGYKSGVETVESISLDQEKSALTGIIFCRSQFKWQGTNQFYEEISSVMNLKHFILGTDGQIGWLFYDGTRDGPGLESCPVTEMDMYANVADPFHLMQKTVESAIAAAKLMYEGQSSLNGHLCDRVECWSVKQTGQDIDPVDARKFEWWIDAKTFLPLQVVQHGWGGDNTVKIHYEQLNEPLPVSAFQPPIPPGAQVKSDDWFQKKLGRGETRFLTIKDGSDGGMSGRMGRRGPNGTTSSGLN